MRKEIASLWAFIEPVVSDAGLELVEIQFQREAGGHVLRVFIDYPAAPSTAGSAEAAQVLGEVALEGDDAGAAHVGHSECERVSRDLSAALDVDDVIKHAYRLEVSSPGFERPLRREADFRRFAGSLAKIRTDEAVDGRRNFSGELMGGRDGRAEIACEGKTYLVPLSIIKRAHLVPDWDAEFGRNAAKPGTKGRRAS